MRIDRVLGRGASSVVYLGTQTRFGREVAVKVLDLPGQPELEETLFVNECRTLGRLTPHPNIVTVFDAGLCDDGRPYLVAEYLPGGTLAQRLEDTGPLPADEVLRIGVRLCGALQTTHLHGIIHGDLKPQNVMTGRSGEPALADFGVSRFLSTAGASTRLPALTPLYAAPELFDGSGPSPGTDIYGLGSTLFELLDGRPALGEPGDSPLLIVGRLSRGERRELDRTVVPGPLADLIEDATATDPGTRPASAQEFGDRLRALQRAAGSTVDEMVVFDDLPPAPTVEPGEAAGPDTIEPARDSGQVR